MLLRISALLLLHQQTVTQQIAGSARFLGRGVLLWLQSPRPIFIFTFILLNCEMKVFKTLSLQRILEQHR